MYQPVRFELDGPLQVEHGIFPARFVEGVPPEQSAGQKAREAPKTSHLRVPLSKDVVPSSAQRIQRQHRDGLRVNLFAEGHLCARAFIECPASECHRQPVVPRCAPRSRRDGRSREALGTLVHCVPVAVLEGEHPKVDRLARRPPKGLVVVRIVGDHGLEGLQGVVWPQKSMLFIPGLDGSRHFDRSGISRLQGPQGPRQTRQSADEDERDHDTGHRVRHVDGRDSGEGTEMGTRMIAYRIIERKRAGETLSDAELEGFLGAYLEGDVPDYQMSAFLMAVFFRGLSDEELDTLLRVMIASGASLDLDHLPGPCVDKHSTGGVGDKVSLVLAPLAAEMGMYVPMMSGRGLGHTGGTLDKIEAIPGFRTDLPLDEFKAVVARGGFGMTAQTPEIAPLDKRLYDLRSVSGTVPAIPLIAASIMSKKLAEGLTGLVLDVKTGRGAFIPDPEKAKVLARTMVRLGTGAGVETVALLTSMDRPLGRAIGNALETTEALDCLAGAGPEDLRQLTLALVAEMMLVGGLAADQSSALRRAAEALDSGRPLERFARVVELQGGDPMVVERARPLPTSSVQRAVAADREGFVGAIDPLALGHGVIELGGGRTRLGDEIDASVGFVLEVGIGDRVAPGQPLGVVHAGGEGATRAEQILRAALPIVEEPPVDSSPLISRRVTRHGVDEQYR